MKRTFFHLLGIASITAIAVGCNKNDDNTDYSKPPSPPQATVLIAAGDSASIIGSIKQFRNLLGDSLNLTTGKTTGRREINWDGVPPALTNNNNFPADFFNSTNAADPAGRKRGLVYVGTGFRVDSSSFTELDASYADQFAPFSRKKLIINAGSATSEVIFKVAGTNTDAFIHGFGVIFSDVDNAASTTLELYSSAGSLGVFKAPVHSDKGGFSFLGVHFADEKIVRVKITSGNGILAAGAKDVSAGGTADLVSMDDFFYDEPAISQ